MFVRSSVDLVTKKWKSIRDTWARAQRRLKEAVKNGTEITSSTIYENQLSFLKTTPGLYSTESSPAKCCDQEDSKSFLTTSLSEQSSAVIDQPRAKRKRKADPSSCDDSAQEKVEKADKSSAENQVKVNSSSENEVKVSSSGEQNQVNKTNRHMAFMEAILPSIQCFDEMDTLEFQAQVLQIVKKMRIEKGYK